MTFSQLRTQVDALCRRFAAQLQVYRLTPPALELCNEMADSVAGWSGPPKDLLRTSSNGPRHWPGRR